MMLPKAHLTSHSRMSGSRWVITPLWLSGLLRSFLYSSSVYSCHLFFISSVVRISNQSILKEISPEYSLVGLMLKLKLQYFAHLMRRVDSLEKNLMLGKIEGQEEKGTTEDETVGWHHRLNGHEVGQALGVGEWKGSLVFCNPWGSQRVRHDWATELNWNTNNQKHKIYSIFNTDSISLYSAFSQVSVKTQ